MTRKIYTENGEVEFVIHGNSNKVSVIAKTDEGTIHHEYELDQFNELIRDLTIVRDELEKTLKREPVLSTP